jgi:hypothetical protein
MNTSQDKASSGTEEAPKEPNPNRWLVYAAVVGALGGLAVAACNGAAMVLIELIKALVS